MPLLDGMISTGRFSEFVFHLMQTHYEEMADKQIWECWLHKVYDKSLNEFKEGLKTETENAAPTQINVRETIQSSFQMLEGFSLVEVQKDGTIQAAGDNSG